MSILVPPYGDPTSRIALVGEAPGAEEEKQGRPFVGDAGALLNFLLTVAEIPRSSVYLTNVIKERPPGNDATKFVDLSKKYPLLTDEFKRYKAELLAELNDTDCKVIVALGGIALHALTDIHPHKISSRRGSIYFPDALPGKRIIACIHPAACLHRGRARGMYIWRYYIAYDLIRARKESEQLLPLPERELITNPSFSYCLEFMARCKKEPRIGFDIECDTNTLEVTHISFALRFGDPSICIPFVNNQGYEYFPLQQEIEVWGAIANVLEDPKVMKIEQSNFDKDFLWHKYGIVTRNTHDTMTAAGIWCPDFQRALHFITSIFTREPYYKDEGKFTKKSKRDPQSFQIYSAKDSAVLPEIFDGLMEELECKDNREAYEIQNRLSEPLLYMQGRGIKVDMEGLNREKERTGKRLGELKRLLNKMVGYEINTASSAQVIDLFYNQKKLPAYKDRKTGNPTCGETALKRLARKGIPEASVMLEIRNIDTYNKMFLQRKIDDDGRLRCQFDPAGASDSGRLSSRKTIWDTGGNLQNTPKTYRRLLLFDEGYAGYEMDLAQAENRIVAFIAPEYTMLSLFETGQDVHSKTGASIYVIINKTKITPDEIRRMDKAGELCPLGNGEHTWREWGKKANHAFNYGFGYKSFALKYECTEGIAKVIQAAYHNTYPNIKGSYWNWIVEKLRIDHMLVNPYGRKRIFKEQWEEQMFNSAYSFIPQSTVASKISIEGLLYVYENQDRFEAVELLNQIHDSIVFQIPLSLPWQKHAEILLDIKRSLETPILWQQRELVIPVDCKVGKNMQEMKEVALNHNMPEVTANILEGVWKNT